MSLKAANRRSLAFLAGVLVGQTWWAHCLEENKYGVNTWRAPPSLVRQPKSSEYPNSDESSANRMLRVLRSYHSSAYPPIDYGPGPYPQIGLLLSFFVFNFSVSVSVSFYFFVYIFLFFRFSFFSSFYFSFFFFLFYLFFSFLSSIFFRFILNKCLCCRKIEEVSLL